MKLTYPNESAQYRAARDRLLTKELELRRAIEAVAAERRNLPPGGLVPRDFRFEGFGHGGRPTTIKLSALFRPGQDTIAIYSYMFGPERASPCPLCTSLLDGLDGVIDHLREHLNFVVVARSSAERLAHFARERGWRRLSLLSTADNDYNTLYHGENADGDDVGMLNVFKRDADGIRHFWGSELVESAGEPGQDHRALDALSALWSTFDLTPIGRPDWLPQVSYAK